MKLNPETTALLTLDFQKGIFGFAQGAESVVPAAAKAVEFARKKKYRVIHVGLGFDKGHPEISNVDSQFKMVKDKNLFVKGSESAEFHSDIAKPEDLVVYKQRVGAFSENQLHMILRAQGIETLILFGLTSSGIVLSTLRRAFDLDYKSIVLRDACYDRDAQTHQLLMEKVFPSQATVLTVDAFIAEQE